MDLYFMLAAAIIWALATAFTALHAREYRKNIRRLDAAIGAWEVQTELCERTRLRFLKALNELDNKNS